MERKTLLIDVDDTLNRMQVDLLRFVNKRSPNPYRYWQLTSSDRESKDNVLDALVQEYLSRPDLVVRTRPFENALEGVKLLHSAGYNLHISSSRKEELHQATLGWLEKHGFYPFITDIHPRPSSIGGPEFKVKTAQKVNAIAAFDDTKSAIDALAESGVAVYLIRRPWNKEVLGNSLVRPYPSFYRAVLGFLNQP